MCDYPGPAALAPPDVGCEVSSIACSQLSAQCCELPLSPGSSSGIFRLEPEDDHGSPSSELDVDSQQSTADSSPAWLPVDGWLCVNDALDDDGSCGLKGIEQHTASSRFARAAPAERSVRFDVVGHVEYAVTPYSEVYGMHPSLFEFSYAGMVVCVFRPVAAASWSRLDPWNGTIRYRTMRELRASPEA